jgi:hypothetical protein
MVLAKVMIINGNNLIVTANYPTLTGVTSVTDNCDSSFAYTQSPTSSDSVDTYGSWNVTVNATDASGNTGNP